MRDKNGQFNFVWLFAIIAGIAILSLAIYGASRAGETARFESDTETAKKLSIITDPLQAGFSEGSFGKINFRQETKINNFCFEPGSFGDSGFGRNRVSVSSKSGVGEEWKVTGEEVAIVNKYIFSSENNVGEEYYVFSKPFEFPYKVADLIFLTSKSYCFIDAPDDIADDILSMNIPNIEVDNCTVDDAINVCFDSGSGCDLRVYGSCSTNCDSAYDSGFVDNGNSRMNYVGNLMYAAIFSDSEIYECNVQRLLYRDGVLAEEFIQKADLMDARGCNTRLKPDLIFWNDATLDSGADDLISLQTAAKNIDKKNNEELCGLW